MKNVRWLSVLLTGLLLSSLIHVTAFAAEEATEGKNITAAAQTSGQERATEGKTTEDSKTSGQSGTEEEGTASEQPDTEEEIKAPGQPDAAEQSMVENTSPAQGMSTGAKEENNGGVEVKTEVRNNYTDTRTNVTVTYGNGIALVDGDQSALNGSVLTFIGLGDLTIQAAYDNAIGKTTLTLDISKIQRQTEEQQYFTEYKENKSKMTTTYDGSKLSYSDSYSDSITDLEGGKVTIHEIRDDYYTRNHVYERACLIIPAAESSPPDKPSDEAEKDEANTHTHTYQWVNYAPATDTADAILAYQCTGCGDIASWQSVPNSAFYQFNVDAANRIAKAPQNGTVTISTDTWISFAKNLVLPALQSRPDVTVIVKYKWKGKPAKLVIPAGTDLSSKFGDSGFCGFLNLFEYRQPWQYGKD